MKIVDWTYSNDVLRKACLGVVMWGEVAISEHARWVMYAIPVTQHSNLKETRNANNETNEAYTAHEEI
jgi:hypothetical protein